MDAPLVAPLSQSVSVNRPLLHIYNIAHQRESLHVSLDDFRMRTLKFLDDLKALVELRKHVRHRAGEQRVFRRLLELWGQKTDKFMNILMLIVSVFDWDQRAYPNFLFRNIQASICKIRAFWFIFSAPPITHININSEVYQTQSLGNYLFLYVLTPSFLSLI